MSDRVRRPLKLLPDGATAMLIAVALACGGTEDQEGAVDGREVSEAPAAAGSWDMPAEQPVLALGQVGSFTGALTGAKDTTYEGSTTAGTVEFFGSCDDDVPLRVGFNVMDDDGVQAARFEGRTDEILEPGETGSFPVETASAWYQRLGLPSRTTFQGAGTLEITHHDARRGSRLMRGHLVGRGLKDSRGESVDVEVAFEVGLSCGVEG